MCECWAPAGTKPFCRPTISLSPLEKVLTREKNYFMYSPIRPFMFEMLTPTQLNVSHEQLADAQRQINSTAGQFESVVFDCCCFVTTIFLFVSNTAEIARPQQMQATRCAFACCASCRRVRRRSCCRAANQLSGFFLMIDCCASLILSTTNERKPV